MASHFSKDLFELYEDGSYYPICTLINTQADYQGKLISLYQLLSLRKALLIRNRTEFAVSNMVFNILWYIINDDVYDQIREEQACT